MLDTSHDPPLPVPVRLGDVDLNGLPDLLLITVDGRKRTPRILLGTECDDDGVAGCKSAGGRLGFTPLAKNVKPLEAIEDARSASFIDLDEDVCS